MGTTRLGWGVRKEWRWKLPWNPQLGTEGGWPWQNTGWLLTKPMRIVAGRCMYILPATSATPQCDTYLCSCVVIFFIVVSFIFIMPTFLEVRSVRLTVSAMARRPTCSLSTNGRRGVLSSEVCHPAHLQIYSRVCLPFSCTCAAALPFSHRVDFARVL